MAAKKTEEKKEVEQDEKEKKTAKRKKSAEERRKAKKIDKVSRWSGAILFFIILFIGGLLWVIGEVKSEQTRQQVMPSEIVPNSATGGRVIVE